MTRKTAARREREAIKRAEKKTTSESAGNCWDELKQLYDGCMLALTNSARIIPILRNHEVMGNFEDINGAIELGKVISKDTTEYRHRLEAIHAEHSQLQGGSQSPDVLMAAIMIGERYQEWYNSYTSVVAPSIQNFLIQADAAISRMNAKKAEAQPAEQETPANE